MSPLPSKDRKITRNDELWIAAKEAACHFWGPANDGTTTTHDRVRAIGFMIAFLARWQVPEAGPEAFCDDIAAAAKGTLADFRKEDAATEAASAPSGEGKELLTNEGSAPSSARQFDLIVDDVG
jgi:hypothetical protein